MLEPPDPHAGTPASVVPHVSPAGEEFEIVGRAGPVELEAAPIVATEARAELLVLKCDDLFLCARRDGDVRPARVSGEGLYTHDTRFLSWLHLRVGDATPVTLSSSIASGHSAVVDAGGVQITPAGPVAVRVAQRGKQRLGSAGRRFALTDAELACA